MDNNPPHEVTTAYHNTPAEASITSTKESQHIDDSAYSPLPTQHFEASKQPWRILLVDKDETFLCEAQQALDGIDTLGRPLEFFHAATEFEALETLTHCCDIAVALISKDLDFKNAGLILIEQIRSLGIKELRVILCTEKVNDTESILTNDLDINHHCYRDELAPHRLLNLLTVSLRDYRQLHMLGESRRGLSLIVRAARDIYNRRNLNLFAQGVLTQLMGLLGQTSSGIICLLNTQGAIPTTQHDANLKVLSAVGRFLYLEGHHLVPEQNWELNRAFNNARHAPNGIYANSNLSMTFTSTDGSELFIYIDNCTELNEEVFTLLKIFATNIASGFEKLALIEKLDHLAYLDPVLNIPNRNALQVEFNTYKNLELSTELLLIHLDALTHLTCVFGAPVVNRAVVEVTRRLHRAFRDQRHFIATDGKSDLFLLCEADQVDFESIKNLFTESFLVDDISLNLSCTIASVKVRPNMDLAHALRCATSALILAKQEPGNSAKRYTINMSKDLAKRITLQSGLRDAFKDRNAIQTYLQPKVRCVDGKLIGAEALTRWHYGNSIITPSEFIPVAEASGLANKITDKVLEQISLFNAQRKAQGKALLPIAVNQSMYELQQPNYAKILHKKILELDLSPEWIEFEITESVMMQNPTKVIEELNTLREFGYRISIDDFGTGYSSLSYLTKLPVSGLKLDKSFIEPINLKNATKSLVATSIAIADHLGMTVVAEGVETEEQHHVMRYLGCNSCQGYYFGKPLPMADFETAFDDALAVH